MNKTQEFPEILSVKEVAKILKLSTGTIYNAISQRPETIPPSTKIDPSNPKSRRIFFAEDVKNWLISKKLNSHNHSILKL